MLVSDQVERRRAEQPVASSAELRGYEKLFYDHVLQAPDGVDFDFLQAKKDDH